MLRFTFKTELYSRIIVFIVLSLWYAVLKIRMSPVRSMAASLCELLVLRPRSPGGATFVSPMIPMSYGACFLVQFSTGCLVLANNWQIIAAYLILYNNFIEVEREGTRMRIRGLENFVMKINCCRNIELGAVLIDITC
jgi:hypothetical protein